MVSERASTWALPGGLAVPPPGHGGKVAKARGHVFPVQGCPLHAPSTTGHISHSPDPEQSPVTFPTTLWLLATWSFFYQCCPDLGAFTHANLFSPQSSLLFFRLFTPLQMGKKKKTRLQRLPCSLPLRRQTEPLTAHMGARSSTCCELIFT